MTVSGIIDRIRFYSKSCAWLMAGVCYTVPLIGGRVADVVAGRFNTIFASFLILALGIVIYTLPLKSIPAVFWQYFPND